MIQDSALQELRSNASLASVKRAIATDEQRWWDAHLQWHQRWLDGDQRAFAPKQETAGKASYLRAISEHLERLTK